MFKLEGDLSKIRSLDQPGQSTRRDNLWKTTCFECFIRDAGEPGYREFNFAANGDWAVYDFESYRRRLDSVPEYIRWDVDHRSDDWVRFERNLVTPAGTVPPHKHTWQIGLSAVIEETDGSKSYWALAHPDGPPDFHHADCFTLELPPPEFSYEVRN